MSKQTLAVFAGGAASGLLYALATGGVLGAAFVAPLPLFLAGLGAGFAASLWASAIGLVLAGAAGGLDGAANYAVASAAPVVLMTRRALFNRTAADGTVEWYPPGLMLAWLSGLGVAVLAGTMVVFSGTPGGLEAEVDKAIATALAGLSAGPEVRQIEAFARIIAPILPGLGIAGWMMVVAVNGIVAQALLVRFGHNLRPSPRVEDVELPNAMPLALAAAAAGAFLGGPVGYAARNAVAILAVPFFFAGLGVVHALVRRLSGGPLALIAFYAIMAMFGWPVLLVAALGLVDQWVAFRARWPREDSLEDK
jgi:hypothetical protein